MYAYGRPAEFGISNQKQMENPRVIFPFNFVSTDGNKLSGQIAPSDYYYYSNDLEISIDTYYEE